MFDQGRTQFVHPFISRVIRRLAVSPDRLKQSSHIAETVQRKIFDGIRNG